MDDDLFAEYKSINKMIDKAQEQGLLVEVIYSFGISMKEGEDVHDACVQALYEWDI